MLEFLEKIKSTDKFILSSFDRNPFQIKSEKDENLSSIFQKIIDYINATKEKVSSLNGDNFTYDDNTIKIEHHSKIYNIYRNPLSFQLFYESYPIFKVYDLCQLTVVLYQLEKYYYFSIDKKEFSRDNILRLKKENKINSNIVLFPHIIKPYNSLCFKIKFDDLKNLSLFNIKKELLEPYFLYIEKMKITKDLNHENIRKFDNNLLEENLTFVMNKERLEFIKTLNEYVTVDIQEKPMIIIGNDGVGKTITLQLYSLIELDNYKKIYFNMKLFEKIGHRNYFFIELLKGFTSTDKNSWKEEFKKYMNIIHLFQKENFSDIKNIFQVINKLMKYLDYTERYIFIFDQFNFENISNDDFYNLKNNMPNPYYKFIICCSLNDNKNKLNLFSDYSIVELFYSDAKNKLPKNNNKNVINKQKEIEKTSDDSITLKNFYLFKKRKRTSDKKLQSNTINKNEENKKNDVNNKDSNDIIINTENEEKNEKDIETKSLDNKYQNIVNIFPPKDFIGLGDIFIQEKQLEIKESFSSEKLKVYYSRLISLEDMLKNKKESKEIINCMAEFNFIPKYYNKFNIFKAKKILNEENNIDKIIELFIREETSRIKNYITDYYSKTYLENKKNANDTNIYQNILKLKRIIAKTYENSIGFSKLYKYIKNHPFKYVNIIMEDVKNDDIYIKFDKKLTNKRFKLRYSFPFVEKVIDEMIMEYDNDDKIKIKDLSGSAYGKTLEFKIRENLSSIKQKIEIRKVWSLEEISDNVKKEKNKEIDKGKKFNKDNRYKDLEDIVGIKEIKTPYNYYKPENQDNKLFDSLFLIKNINEYYIVVLQITKYKDKKELRTKEDYSAILENKIKVKFENLYGIKINKIFLWFILCNETDENETLCLNLNKSKMKYAFYSINKKCFFKKRNSDKIDYINYFMDEEALIFPLNNIDDSAPLITPYPFYISLFENTLYNDFENNNEIFFENIRKSFFDGNCGPKLENGLRNNIISKLKGFISYLNDFELLFIYSFPLKDISEYRIIKENDEFVYLFKIKSKVYILFKDNSFKICSNHLKKCSLPNINQLKIKAKEKYHKQEFTLSDMEDIYANPLIYLYKIYYLGDELLPKPKEQ